MELKIRKMHPDVKLPEYSSDGAGCFDIFAYIPTAVSGRLLQEDGDSTTIQTGLEFEVPEGFAMMIYSRSGHGFKKGVRLSNCVGIIDSDYRGEVMVKLIKDGNDFSSHPLRINDGDRIAQAMIVPVPKIKFVEVSELSDTDRGRGGFGSTGA